MSTAVIVAIVVAVVVVVLIGVGLRAMSRLDDRRERREREAVLRYYRGLP